MTINWKRWLLITIALLNITFITTACAPPTNPNQVVFSILSDPKTFNAVLSAESPNIFGYTYEGLIT